MEERIVDILGIELDEVRKKRIIELEIALFYLDLLSDINFSLLELTERELGGEISIETNYINKTLKYSYIEDGKLLFTVVKPIIYYSRLRQEKKFGINVLNNVRYTYDCITHKGNIEIINKDINKIEITPRIKDYHFRIISGAIE